MKIDGADLIVALACLLAVVLLLDLWQWSKWNDERKLQRRVSRNLTRATGGRT